MVILTLAFKSLKNRWITVSLTILSIALSVTLFMGVERIRLEAKTGFTNTVSGTDLIVGARTSPIQLLLSSVFRLSDMPNNIGYHSFEEIASMAQVKWAIPISLGDSHAGYRVLGTDGSYYEYLRYGKQQNLQLFAGKWFKQNDEAVIGYSVARSLGYGIGDSIRVSHGSGEVSFIHHDEHPFTVVGILERTGTPVDQTIHVDLAGIDAIHAEMNNERGDNHDPLFNHTKHEYLELPHASDNGKQEVTAVFLGLKSKSGVLVLQRSINDFTEEPLTAIIPGVALQMLWGIVGAVERSLLIISGFVVGVGLMGMLIALLTSLNERRREMAILRAVGAKPKHIFSLIVGEAAIVTFSGVSLGVILLYSLLFIAKPLLFDYLGVFISIGAITGKEIIVLLVMWLVGVFIGIIPGYRIYRYSVNDGMTVRI